MKLILNTVFYLFLSLAAFAGDEGPHGGDDHAFEFQSLGRFMAEESSERSINNLFPFNDQTIIYSDTPNLVQINGQEVDAINYPSKKVIIVNRDRWREKSLRQKLGLIIHEYFGIQQLELDSFEKSSLYQEELERLSKQIIDKNPRLVSYSSLRTTLKPLYSTNKSSCDVNLQNVKESLEQAKESAIQKCQSEIQGLCQVEEIHMESKSSSQVPGLSSCEIEVLVKAKI